jgi:Tat protein translocase TatB subunit
MFEIGFWEMIMVGVVMLIVVGPERLPGLARTAGLWIGKARRMFAEVKADVDRNCIWRKSGNPSASLPITTPCTIWPTK